MKLGNSLAVELNSAARRHRLDRVIQRGALSLSIAAAVIGVWLILCLFLPALRPFSVGLILVTAGGIGISAIVFFISPAPKTAAARRLDREHGLPDSVLSASELDEERKHLWRDAQLEDTLRNLQASAPARQRTGLRRVYAILAFLGILIGATLVLPNPAEAKADSISATQAEDLRALFDDWEKAQKEQPDPQLEALLKELEPIREKLEQGGLPSRDLLVQLSKIEDRLQDFQRQLASASLDPFAASIADALRESPDMEALAAALDKKDYERAEKAAQALESGLNSNQSPMPSGLSKASAQKKLGDLASQMSSAGQASMAESMQNLASAAQTGNRDTMSKGAKGMRNALAQQNARDSQCKNLGLQARQLGLCKECMGNNSSMSMCLSLMPKLSFTKSQKPSSGAGRATNLAREGSPTQAIDPMRKENVSGVADSQGDSETTTISSTEAPSQLTVSVANADLGQYQKLSEQAIEDESLPLARRRTIRKYFEMIRTSGETQTP